MLTQSTHIPNDRYFSSTSSTTVWNIYEFSRNIPCEVNFNIKIFKRINLVKLCKSTIA